MGRSLFSFTDLLPPVRSMQERYVLIPPGRTLEAANQHFKLVCFLEGGVEMLLPDGRAIAIQRWDAFSLDLPWTLRYRAQDAGREVRNHVLVMQFTREVEDPPQPALINALFERLEGFQYFPAALMEIGPRLLHEIREEAERGPAWSRWRVNSLVLQILGAVMEGPATAPSGTEPVVDRGLAMVNHARQYIEEHAREKLTLNDIAWQLQLSGEHLARLFKKHAGYTVFDYVDQVRLERAKQLLLTTESPLAQIASMCGYGSANLLGRHFKQSTGQTPLEYRLRGRGKESFSPSIFAK